MQTRGVVLVTGAAGRQGGAVARLLLACNWPVRALTRDPRKPAARRLAAAGAQIVKGDLNDAESLTPALKNVYAVFSVQDFGEHGYKGEVRQGKTLADAARAHDIQHFIYSSAAAANDRTGLPFFESKWEVEQYIRELCLPATILRPVAFMENFEWPHIQAGIRRGSLRLPLRSNKPIQLIAIDDLALFVLMALKHPDEYLGQTLELASDELTMPEAAEVFSQIIGRSVRYYSVPMFWARLVARKQVVRTFAWLNEHGYRVDIGALRARFPQLMTLDGWAVEKGWGRGNCLARANWAASMA